MIYCDHAATSFPKPPAVHRAMAGFLADTAVSPGRSGFDLALAAGGVIDDLRGRVGRLMGNPADDPDRTVFSANATDALNTALVGLCEPGDHVVSTVLEHNSVLRPLTMLERSGLISFDLAPCDGAGFVDPEVLAGLIRPSTRLVVLNHASNVLGTVQAVAQIGAICRRQGVLLLLDAAQTAGTLPIDMAAQDIDAVAFTGHKGLQGPTGTGGLVLGPRAEPGSSRWGGTGVRSEQLSHPQDLPYRLESGTPNGVGLAGLAAGLQWLQDHRPGEILDRERALTSLFVRGCRCIDGVTVLGHEPGQEARHLAVVSLVAEGMDPQKIGLFLDANHGVAVRTGLQCAPLVHQAMGTAPLGTVRFSFGPLTTEADIRAALGAVEAVCSR